jgi:BirA family biotin operon repressor/biotin-[acetyl-CoA-carboxylase] ligase
MPNHPPDRLDEQTLRQALGARPFQFHPVVSSTNDLARAWAERGAPHGSLVLAEEQSAGRGRFARPWSAPPETALLMSVVLRPRLAPARLTYLTMLGAVAAAETLEPLAPGQVALKWPNDVQLAGRKVAGVLVESAWSGDDLVFAVLGLGLNVRIDFADTPLEGRATSLEIVSGRPVRRAALLAALLTRIDHWALRLSAAEVAEELFAVWRARLATLGQPVSAQTQTETISGVAEAVDPEGALLIRRADGSQARVTAGEVTLSG